VKPRQDRAVEPGAAWVPESGVAAPRPPPRPLGVTPGGDLRGFVAVSVAVHLVAGALALLWWLPPRRPDEVPATVEVLFGDNAEVAGAPTPASAAPRAAAAPSAASAAAGRDGVLAPAAAASGGAAATAAASLPVRLGDGDIGLKLDQPPDAGMIEAQADPGNRAPKYPDMAWRLRQHGRVVIRMHIDTDGRVTDTEILESSGHPALDRAARDALAKWRFIPALRDGVAVPSFRDQSTDFVLE
jgi:protein TonB